MVFERRTLPVATWPVDISFVALWGGEASRAMVSLAGPFGSAGQLCCARISLWLHAAKSGAGFACFPTRIGTEPPRKTRNPGAENREPGFTSNFN
jgi:hypothetical protein